jgi:hypothetical protein
MTEQRFYPVFTIAKSLSAKTKPDSSDENYITKNWFWTQEPIRTVE